ncbi:MAG: ParB N-terminal domain-containing protein [Desulfuromonadaceae bacterium]|nr:ParB N-terminal domain-containing protein [Desulfuromonadaceae bacterium]
MTVTTQTTYEKGKLFNLNIADLQPDPEQPRKYFDEQALADLKASIVKHGVYDPDGAKSQASYVPFWA